MISKSKNTFSIPGKSLSFLIVKGGDIVDLGGRKVVLRGINFVSLIGEQFIRDRETLKLIQDVWVTDDDLITIRSLGANHIRFQFYYSLLEDDRKPFNYLYDGFKYLDKVINLCEKYNIYCLLDMHGVQGGQNFEVHSGNRGKNEFWGNKTYQQRFIALWKEIARRYASKKCGWLRCHE